MASQGSRPALAVALVMCVTSALNAEAWYALAESLDSKPYGCQYYSGETPAVYNGKKARKASLRMVYVIEALGERVEGENYKEFYMESRGGLMGFMLKQQAGEEAIISEGEFRRDGLYVRRHKEGSAPDASPQKLTPPTDVLFAVSPSFLWPLVSDADGKVSFQLFDIASLSSRPGVAMPAGFQDVTIGGRTWHARKYTLELRDARDGSQARQMLYFDPKTGTLVLSETIGATGSVVGVMYLADSSVAENLSARRIRPDSFPARDLPLLREKPYLYTISMQGGKIGRGYFMLNPAAAVGRYEIEEMLRLVGPQEERKRTATLFLSSDLTFTRYKMSGKVSDPTASVVNVAYNRTASMSGGRLVWEAWAKDIVANEPALSKRGKYQLSDSVYLLDNHLVSGFAVLASQVPLYQGGNFTVGVYHANIHKLGMMNVTVRDKVSVKGKNLYKIDLMGFCGRYTLFVEENGFLRQVALVIGPQGERNITYDVVH